MSSAPQLNTGKGATSGRPHVPEPSGRTTHMRAATIWRLPAAMALRQGAVRGLPRPRRLPAGAAACAREAPRHGLGGAAGAKDQVLHLQQVNMSGPASRIIFSSGKTWLDHSKIGHFLPISLVMWAKPGGISIHSGEFRSFPSEPHAVGVFLKWFCAIFLGERMVPSSCAPAARSCQPSPACVVRRLYLRQSIASQPSPNTSFSLGRSSLMSCRRVGRR